MHFILNNEEISTALPPGMVLLDFIRNHQRLVGTKIGCREGDCGACTVLVGDIRDNRLRYRSMTSCLMPLGNAAGKHIVTVEGLNRKQLTPYQQAIVDQGGSQCGFCTPGFVVSLAGFCLDEEQSSYENAIAAMDGNICRCTGYKSIERAASLLVEALSARDAQNPVGWLAANGFLPDYFTTITEWLASLQDVIRREATPPVQTHHFLGGGTDLYVQKPVEMAALKVNLLFDQPELQGIREVNGCCYIGGATTVEDLHRSAVMNTHFPHMKQFMKLVSSTPIRNMATVAGNLVNASPIGDLTVFLLALDSRIVFNDQGRQRTLPLKEFYQGYKELDKSPTEILQTVFFDLPGQAAHFNFEKVCKRTHLDIASVNSAMQLEIADGVISRAGLSAGGVAPIPFFLDQTASFLKGQKVTATTVRQAAATAQQEIAPISDIRGSAAYKRLLLRQLILAHFLAFFPSELQVEALL
jgi:xanthine dehydrogenase small subunit